MKIKGYGLFEGEKQVLLLYSNPSQKQFLDFELKNCLSKTKKLVKIQFDNTANGVWYYRQHRNRYHNIAQLIGLTQIVLISKQSSSISIANGFLGQVAEIEKKFNVGSDRDKVRYKIDDLMKIYNANSKVDSLSSNVMELEDIMKGNINKIVGNMSELDTAERKSTMMAQMSMQFQRDSRALEQKMKKRKCLMKAMIIGLISLVLGIILWFVLL